MRYLPLVCLVAIAACAADAPDSGAPVEYVHASIDPVEPLIFDVRVGLRNPGRRISTERYAACVAADHAKASGFVWVDRLRGRRRIDAAREDLVVRFGGFRFDKPTGKDVFSAALFLRLCEVDDIPTGPLDPPEGTEIPPLVLDGAEPPTLPPGTILTNPAPAAPVRRAPPPPSELPDPSALPDIPDDILRDQPPTDPDVGI